MNQIASVTESIELVKMSKQVGWGVMTSHQSGETEDTSIADLSVGLATDQSRLGAPCSLNKVPSYLFSPTLKELTIVDCPELSGLQCLPPLLESLFLWEDCVGYSASIPVAANKECSITHFTLFRHPHSSLPDRFKELNAFYKCSHLDFNLIELQHFTML